ncbi:myosin heavy chain kinase B-like isoform X2 [Mya arenaria]|nr:myosin heavy chain kinase B-like isoform X2 [Mya arenaria]XP_052788423.1 myosin heavy chain kinase B-like isoform X2 [Mya arenaria]
MSVIVKVFGHTHGGTKTWGHYKAVGHLARQFAEPFNSYLGTTNAGPKVEFLTPEMAIMNTQSDFQMFARFFWNFKKIFSEDEAVVIERRLKGDFITYVHTTGHATHEMSALPAAFCHFSYQESGVQFVICNLQGVHDKEKFVFTNPVIHSISETFGESDKGAKGIATFFENHVCTYLCQDFIKPGHIAKEFTALDEDRPPRYSILFPDRRIV